MTTCILLLSMYYPSFLHGGWTSKFNIFSRPLLCLLVSPLDVLIPPTHFYEKACTQWSGVKNCNKKVETPINWISRYTDAGENIPWLAIARGDKQCLKILKHSTATLLTSKIGAAKVVVSPHQKGGFEKAKGSAGEKRAVYIKYGTLVAILNGYTKNDKLSAHYN